MKVVISGYYGFDNAGDEAVLAAMLADLRRLCPDLEPVVLSGAPARTARRHGVHAIPRLAPTAVRQALRGADLFISGGGTLLQDATGWGSVPYYGGLMMLAQRSGVPVFVYAQGIGPLRRPVLRRWAGRALAAARGVTVRDAASAAEARRLGVPAERLAVTADPVFGFAGGGGGAALSGAAERLLSSLPDGPIIGVSLRPVPGGGPPVPARALSGGSAPEPDGDPAPVAVADLADRVAAGLRPRLAALGARALPLPLYPAQDAPLLAGLQAALGPWAVPWPPQVDPAAFSPGDWLAVCRRLDLCLTMRLHGLIFAACAGVPFVACGDDPKLAGHVDELGLPRDRFLVPEAGRWCDALTALWTERDRWRPVIARGAARLAERARATALCALAAAGRAAPGVKEAVR